jgi:hypothetical protein
MEFDKEPVKRVASWPHSISSNPRGQIQLQECRHAPALEPRIMFFTQAKHHFPAQRMFHACWPVWMFWQFGQNAIVLSEILV